MLKRRFLVPGFALAVLLFAGSASAQIPTAPPPTAPTEEPATTPPTNLMLGYAYFHDFSWDEHLLYGWVLQLSQRVGKNISIVGEFGGSHGEYGSTGFTIQRYALLGGIRLYGGEGRARPFFQVQAGASRQGGDVGIANGWALQPGGGAEFELNSRWSLRGQGDFRVIFEDGKHYNSYRFSGGIVLSIGKTRK